MISESKTIRYFGIDSLGNESTKKQIDITIDKQAAVTTSNIASGLYNKNKAVELSSNEATRIYYTLDGSIPSTNSLLYSNAIVVTSNVEIKFFSIDTVGNIESAKSVTIN